MDPERSARVRRFRSPGPGCGTSRRIRAAPSACARCPSPFSRGLHPATRGVKGPAGRTIGPIMSDAPSSPLVLVVDFGAQYAQLIARRVREARVYSEIVPHTWTAAPRSWSASRRRSSCPAGPPRCTPRAHPHVAAELFASGIPTFGMCYGFQAMARALGGRRRPDEYAGVRTHRRCPSRHLVHAVRGQPGRADRVDVARRLGGRRARGASRSPGRPRARRSPRSRTTSSGSTVCSTTPRFCTPSTASRCWRTSCTTPPGSSRLDHGQHRRRAGRRDSRAGRRQAGDLRLSAGWTPRSPRRSCSAPSATS
jgi:hypothetical protein